MKWIASALLILCTSGIALADGGETIGTATVIPSLPYQDSGNTCGHVNDYDAVCPYGGSSAPELVYEFAATSDVNVEIQLCGSSFDTKLYVYAGESLDAIACNDDGCGESWTSRIPWLHLVAGTTYYLVIDGYGASCGSYLLDVILLPPCVVECPVGAQIEGEPGCEDGYVDSYDGGCNGSGWVEVRAQDGGCAVLCGRSCTYRVGGQGTKDYDWYVLTAAGGPVTATLTAEFPVVFGIVYGLDCATPAYTYTMGDACEDLTVQWYAASGQDLWVFVYPELDEGLAESSYRLHICGIEGGPTPVVSQSWGRIKNTYRDASQ